MKLNKKIIAPLAVLLVAPTLMFSCSCSNGAPSQPEIISFEDAQAWLDEHSKTEKIATSATLSWNMNESCDWASLDPINTTYAPNFCGSFFHINNSGYILNNDLVGSYTNNAPTANNERWQFNGSDLAGSLTHMNGYVYELSANKKQLTVFKTKEYNAGMSNSDGCAYVKHIFDDNACRTSYVTFFGTCALQGPSTFLTGEASLVFGY